jgi:hypothetical protein
MMIAAFASLSLALLAAWPALPRCRLDAPLPCAVRRVVSFRTSECQIHSTSANTLLGHDVIAIALINFASVFVQCGIDACHTCGHRLSSGSW